MTARIWTVQRAATLMCAAVLAGSYALTEVAFAQDVAPAAAPAAAAPEATQAPVRHHALSLVGTPKYPADFKNFDWVNPDAPKGGSVRMYAPGSFDNFNQFTINGVPASGINMINDTLMAESLDEPSTEYGLIAEWVSFPPDYSSATFAIRSEAQFSDGQPITLDDVIFSLDAIRTT